jgi:hypothetical protein
MRMWYVARLHRPVMNVQERPWAESFSHHYWFYAYRKSRLGRTHELRGS